MSIAVNGVVPPEATAVGLFVVGAVATLVLEESLHLVAASPHSPPPAPAPLAGANRRPDSEKRCLWS